MSCPICNRRPAKRFCPAKGEKICEVCCGREREVTIDCPSDCRYLLAARRHQREHRKPLPREQAPYADLEFPESFVYDRWPVVGGLASVILGFQAQHRELNDRATVVALEALAETFRTLTSGIYYERQPDAPVSRALYGELARFIEEARKDQASRGVSQLKDPDVLKLLVVFLRIAKIESDGRPLSGGFIDFLRTKFVPQGEPAGAKEASRIIIP
jgi:hypothetical protein